MSELVALLGRELPALLPVSDRVTVVFLEADGESMRIYRVLPAPEQLGDTLPRVRVEGTPVGRVVREAKGRVVADVRQDPNITFGHASHGGIRSTVSTPIWVGGRVVGALNAGSRTPGACDEQMLSQLEQVAAFVGPAMFAAEQVFAERVVAEQVVADAGEAREARDIGECGADVGSCSVANAGLSCPGLVGRSPAFLKLLGAAHRVAKSDADVLLSGETGVGKTAIARAMHCLSERKGGPFVTVHIADLSSTLVESELFGHERGAYTGALTERLGRFESAHGGTIFLDEIGETPPSVQAKLLRVIQDRRFERVGGSRTVEVDVRVIAATSRDLHEAMRAGEFREDLFYRLNVVPLRVPALRDRVDDLEPLVESLLNRLRRANGRALRLSAQAWQRLRTYSWPGNIRELESVLRRATILEDGDVLQLPDFPDHATGSAAAAAEWPTLKEHERRYIGRVLELCGGVIEGPRGAATLLGMRPSTLRSRMGKLGISAQPMRKRGPS